MSQKNGRSTENCDDVVNISADEISFCFMCGRPASAGKGPVAEKPMCQEHYDLDVVYVQNLHIKLKEKINPYPEIVPAFVAQIYELDQRRLEIENQFEAIVQQISGWKAQMLGRVDAQREAVQKYLDDCKDIEDYNKEVQAAQSACDWLVVRNLAIDMQASIPDLEADLRNATDPTAINDKAELARLQELKRVVDDCVCEAGDTLPEPWKAANSIKCISHEVKINEMLNWVTVCSESTDFRSDRTGRVIRMPFDIANCTALPQPCIIAAAVKGMDHLIVLSLDGLVRLRIHCEDINWDNYIWGLHCAQQKVFVAQEYVVTVTDLSGNTLRQIQPKAVGLSSFKGIGGNAVTLFVSGGNKIVAFNKDTWMNEGFISLNEFPDATLYNLAVHNDFILVIDRKHAVVRKVSVDLKQLVDSYPAAGGSGFVEKFEWPRDLTADNRGRLFVSECGGHSVRALSTRDGSLLWTLGEPGKVGCDLSSLYGPSGLAVVPGAGRSCDQLVVSDCWNKRLLILNLH